MPDDRARRRTPRPLLVSLAVCGLFAAGGCGYSTRPGLAGHLQTVYVQPFTNRIDITQVATNVQRFPIYRHGMERDLTTAVLNRFQFTGLLRPAAAERADARLEGEIVEFRRDALRYSRASDVEEWRLSVVVDVRFYDQTKQLLLWEEPSLTGDTTYFESGADAESEASALDRAMTDVARRIVERVVESW